MEDSPTVVFTFVLLLELFCITDVVPHTDYSVIEDIEDYPVKWLHLSIAKNIKNYSRR